MKNIIKRTAASLLAIVMVAILAASFCIVPVSAASDTWDGESIANAYDSGTGAENDPYIIATGAQLAFLGEETLAGKTTGKYYKLTTDINLNGKPWKAIGTNTAGQMFAGVFDGDNHTVSGLYCDEDIMTTTFGGLFGYADGAILKNINVEGSLVRGRYAGSLLAKATATSVINCHANVEVVDGITVGGLIGRIDSGTEKNVVTYCTNSSTVVQNTTRKGADYFIAGVIACAGNVDISYCANFGDVNVSRSYGNATDNAENVTSQTVAVGGIIGCVGASSQPTNISYSYNTGNITGYEAVTTSTAKSWAGGIAGKVSHVANSVVNGCYSTGVVTWPKEMGGSDKGDRAGGLFGEIAKEGVLTYCYTTEPTTIGLDTARSDKSKDIDILTLTLDKMQGSEALKNMNLGTSLSAVLDTAISNAMANANYFSWQLEAMEEYTGGKTLDEYIEEYVLGEFNLEEGAELWTVNANGTPSLGDLDAILVSAEIPVKTGDLVAEKLDDLWAQYEADPAHTSEEEDDDTVKPNDDTTAGRVTVVVGKDTTKKPVTTADPTDNNNNGGESSCGGFTAAIAAAFVSVCALAVLVVVKKK